MHSTDNRGRVAALFLSAALATAACGGTPTPSTPRSADLALVNVNVLPMDEERVLTGQTLLIEAGRIVEMGPAADVVVPDGARVVQLDGKYVLPGLGEMHGHLAGPNAEMNDRIVRLNVAHGILTVRSMLGHPAQLELRDRIARGEVPGPRIYTSGPSANGNTATTAEQGAQLAREQHAAGYDLIKIHPGVTREAFDAMATTAKSVGIPFAGHVPAAVGVHHAIASGYRSIDHLDGYAEAAVRDGVPLEGVPVGFFGSQIAQHLDDAKIPALVEKTKAAGVWVVPTETLLIRFLDERSPEESVSRPEMAWLPAEMATNWANARRSFQAGPQFSTRENRARLMAFRSTLIKALQAQGVGILLGADAPQVNNIPGLATHEELHAVVRAGLTPYQALVSGTRNVAVYFGTQADSGTVATGKLANLLVLDANPLDDITNSLRRTGVVLNGTWHDRDALDRLLEP
ncbi:MAG: amidohydrolase family protein [Acidobacteria bacterium]|nr:amidohydrolase family protein [Acidobacteriota bacterium]